MRTTALPVTVIIAVVVVAGLQGRISGLREALREHCADKYIRGVSDGRPRE
jgi:hypothetical protein